MQAILVESTLGIDRAHTGMFAWSIGRPLACCSTSQYLPILTHSLCCVLRLLCECRKPHHCLSGGRTHFLLASFDVDVNKISLRQNGADLVILRSSLRRSSILLYFIPLLLPPLLSVERSIFFSWLFVRE